MGIDTNDFAHGLRVKSENRPSGTLTGDVLTTGSGRLYVIESDSGAYGFVPAGILESDYEVDDAEPDAPAEPAPAEPAGPPEPTPTNPI